MADKILKQVGLIPETDETGQPPAATPALFNGPFGVTQENFDALEPIVQDVLAAKGDSRSLAEKLAGVDTAIGNLETSDAVSVSKAVRLAWKRSDEGYAVEQFSPNMTLITFEPINVTRTVAGDDSVDVESTASLKVGNTYVISGDNGQESITVSEILNATRFKATANLARTLGGGKLGQTDWEIYSGYAIAPAGGVYYSSAMEVLRYYGDGMLDIRRDDNEGKLDVQVRTKGGNWQAAKLLETVGEEPGTRNEFYRLPVGGIVELKVTANEKVNVDYMMVYTSPEAGRAYPVAMPVNESPAPGAVSVTDPVTLTGSAPRSLYGLAIASATVRIATDPDMQNVVYTGTVNNPTGKLNHTAATNTLEVDKNYWWDFDYTDEDGNTSPKSKATGFTTAATFKYVVPPMIISPASDSTGVMAPLKIQLSEFAVFNTADNHVASRVEASTTPDFTNVFYDSGEVAAGNEIVITEEDGLIVSSPVYLRPYHKGENLGWSAAGPVSSIVMSDVFELNYWGNGSDGDAVIAADTALPSTLNGDIVVKNYKSLTVDAGATLTVDKPCRGLMIYVDGDCTINGTISMNGKGCKANPADSVVTSNTPVPPSDGNPVDANGFVLTRFKAGGVSIGSGSNLNGCGNAAKESESNQKAVDVGLKLVFPRNRNSSIYGGNGGKGGNRGACYGIGSLSGQSGQSGVIATCFGGGFGGEGGDGGGNDNGGLAPLESGGLLILIVKGKLTIGPDAIVSADGVDGNNGGGANSGNCPTSSGNVYGGGGGGGAAGGSTGGWVVILHAGQLTNNGSINVDGGNGGLGGPGGWGGPNAHATPGSAGENGIAGASGTIRIEQVEL
ncbi:hypothetical protein [Maridesulfovibrio sp.]|uniref:hypothetical protein n=1 Tax=Maridesulfovibrio sp. TaxID=2795000 RepID=UPI002A1874A6|nr:hypothetical protein [Maridesulfovibrio sp.]